MRSLILLPRAEVDLFDAAIWYEGEREGLGRAFESDFDRVVSRIQASPLQFPEIDPEVRRAMLTRFPYGVFFLIADEVVTVFAVLHLHRDPEALRGRR
jgi:toxin ParE1/3/4